jgi:hypothetical protein
MTDMTPIANVAPETLLSPASPPHVDVTFQMVQLSGAFQDLIADLSDVVRNVVLAPEIHELRT